MRIRDILDSPLPDAPSFHTLFRLEIAEEQDALNELNNTSHAWTNLEYRFNYTCGVDTYPINVSNFGKAIQVVRVMENCFIRYLPVPFDDFSTQSYGRILGGYYGGCGQNWPPLGLTDTLEHITFYRAGTLNTQPMLKINPMPSCNAEYIITYLAGYQGTTDPLSASVNMPEHVELIRLRIAMAALPYAQWFTDEEQNRIKRKDLAAAFAYQLERKEQIYKQYIASMAHPRDVWIDSWNGY